MRQLRMSSWSGLTRGLALSVIVHLLALAALVVTLPTPEPDAEPEEQVVEVTLVPPEEVEPPQAEPEEPPSPDVSEPAPEPEPEPPALAPPTETEPPEEPEQPVAEAEAEIPAPPIPVLRPVFEFGPEDRGPRQETDGDSARDQAEPEPVDEQAAAEPPDEPVTPDPATTRPAAPEPTTEAVEAEPVDPTPDASETTRIALPELALPEADLPVAAPEDVDPAEPPARSELTGVPEQTSEPETEKATDTPSPAVDAASADDLDAEPQSELVDAGRLFSPVLTEDRAAMVAMGSLPREMRASQLCTTELREQLSKGTPRYGVELLPAYRLDKGNVLAVGDAAFRADGGWYDLSFRCTVDDDAYRVVSFAHRVGQPIPQDQWAARGFPSF